MRLPPAAPTPALWISPPSPVDSRPRSVDKRPVYPAPVPPRCPPLLRAPRLGRCRRVPRPQRAPILSPTTGPVVRPPVVYGTGQLSTLSTALRHQLRVSSPQ